MRKTTLSIAVAAALATAQVQAGSLAEPVVEPVIQPEVIIEDTSSSAAGWVVPLMLLVVIAAIAASNTGAQPAPSDARLKTGIIPAGTAANGVPLYTFSYVGLPGVYQGVMAQDVLAHTPEAVVHMPGGYMAVNYDMLGLEMQRVR